MIELLVFLLAIGVISAISWLEARCKAKTREEIMEELEAAGRPFVSLIDWLKKHRSR